MGKGQPGCYLLFSADCVHLPCSSPIAHALSPSNLHSFTAQKRHNPFVDKFRLSPRVPCLIFFLLFSSPEVCEWCVCFVCPFLSLVLKISLRGDGCTQLLVVQDKYYKIICHIDANGPKNRKGPLLLLWYILDPNLYTICVTDTHTDVRGANRIYVLINQYLNRYTHIFSMLIPHMQLSNICRKTHNGGNIFYC